MDLLEYSASLLSTQSLRQSHKHRLQGSRQGSCNAVLEQTETEPQAIGLKARVAPLLTSRSCCGSCSS